MKIHDEIEKLEKELAEKRKVAATFDKLTPEQQLATELHEMFCRSNHIDQCGWGYEKWDDYETRQYSTRRDYVEKARRVMKLLSGFSHEQIIEVARALR